MLCRDEGITYHVGNDDYFAHPNALIEDGARIGSGTRVWAFAHVQSGAAVGTECNICNYVFVESGARLGDRVTVKNGVQIWDGVTIDDQVFLGPNCVFTNDLRPRSRAGATVQPTAIQQGATIGAGAIVLCGLTIGRSAFVAAGALVTRDVPPFAMVWGHPARFRYWISRAAERLDFTAGDGLATCATSGFTYRLEGDRVVELPT